MPPLAATKVSLRELADLAIGTPELGTVNFTALHTLLVAILKNLNLLDTPVDFQSTPSPEQSRVMVAQRASASTPQLAPAKDKRRSSGGKLEVQMKDLGSQVQDLGKQFKAMENQVQGIVTHLAITEGHKLGPDIQEWPDDKEATGLPWTAGRATVKHLKEAAEAVGQHRAGGRDSRGLKDVTGKVLEAQRKAQEARREDGKARREDGEALREDEEAKIKDEEPELTPQGPAGVSLGRGAGVRAGLPRLAVSPLASHCSASDSRDSPQFQISAAGLGSLEVLFLLGVAVLLGISVSELFFQKILQRVEELEKAFKEQEEFLDVVRRKLSIMPPSEEATMVTWEELEHAITDGWRASQQGSETAVALPKHRGQSSAERVGAGPPSSKPPSSVESAPESSSEQPAPETGGPRYSTDRAPGQDGSRAAFAAGHPARELHQASLGKAPPHPAPKSRADADHRRSREHLRRDPREVLPGQQDLAAAREPRPYEYPDHHVGVRFSQSHIYQTPDQQRLGLRGTLPGPSLSDTVPHAASQLGMLQPGPGQGAAPPTVSPFGVGPPLVPGTEQVFEPPPADQHSLGPYQAGLMPPGAAQQLGSAASAGGPPGAGQRGLVPVGIDPRGFVIYGVDQPGLVSPLTDQYGLAPASMMQVAAGQQGLVGPSLGLSGIIQPGLQSPDMIQARAGQPAAVQPAAGQLGMMPPGAYPSSLAQPEAGQPGVDQPGVADVSQFAVGQPGMGEPGRVQLGMGLPGVVQPGVSHPGMDQPGVGQPGVGQPGTGQPSMVEPGVVQPGVGQPGIVQPGVGYPSMVQPGVGQLGMVPFGVAEPGMIQPGMVQPGMVQPGVGQPSVAPFGMGQPGMVPPGPEAGQPGIIQFGVGQPGMTQPGMVQPSVDQTGVVQPEAGQPGIIQFGVGQPGMVQSSMGPPDVVQSGVGQPDVGQSGVSQPGVALPGVALPGVGQPGLVQSGMALPGVGQLGVGQPGLVQPGVGQPGMGQPGLVQPGMGQPGVAPPGMGQPGVGQPGLVQPGVGQPGVGQPGVALPGMSQLDMGQPGLVQPGVAPLGMGQLGMGQPGLVQPGMALPGMGQPGMGQPGVAPPGVGQPGMGQPGMGQPGVAPPGVDQPAVAPPGMGQPGMGQPGLVQPGVAPPGMGQPGLVQPGMGQSGLAPPGMGHRGLVQPGVAPPGMGQPGVALPGMGQPGLVQPGVGQPGMAPPGMGQPGLVQPGVVPPGMGQPGLVQPGMAPPGLVQPGMGQPGMGQPGLVQPGVGEPGPYTGQPSLVIPRMYHPLLVQPRMDEQSSVQSGVDESGPAQLGMDQHGLGQPGVGQQGFAQPGMYQRGAGQPGAGQPGVGQPGAGQPGVGQPGVGQPGVGQPGAGQPGAGPFVPAGAYPRGLVPAGAYPRGLVPAGAYPRGLVPAGAYPRGLVPAGAYPHGFIPPGADQYGLFQPGVDPRGFILPDTDSRGFPAFHADSRSSVLPHQYQYGVEPPGSAQHGQPPAALASQGLPPRGVRRKGLVRPGAVRPPSRTHVVATHPGQQPLGSPGPDRPDQATPHVDGPSQEYATLESQQPLSVDKFTQLGLEPSQLDISVPTAPGQAVPPDYVQRVSSEGGVIQGDRHDSLEKLTPNFPFAVETFRLMGELVSLYTELKESIKDLDEEQAHLTDLEKIQLVLASMVQKTMPSDLQEQLKSLKSLTKDLRQERAKLERIEKILESGDLERGKELKPDQLSLQLGLLRLTVSDIEKELAELRESQERGKATMENSVSEASLYLQGQLDKLRTIIENMLASSSTLLSMSMVPQKTLIAQSPGEVNPKAACPACSLDLGHQVSLLVQRYEQLQDMVSSLAASRPSKKAKLQGQDEELLGHVQSAILQVQGDCEKLNITTSSLIEDHRQKQKDIDVLYQGIEKLQKEKANREHLDMEIGVKADKSALAAKVSRVQFDATTEQLNHMMQELVAKMSGQEQDWQKMVDKLLLEMDSKLDRLELDPVKQLLEDRWKSLRQQLKERSPLYQADEAAAMRRQLLVHFHCLSCDRPLETPVTGQIIPMTPVGPGLPGHRSTRPYTVFELEQIRQQGRSSLKLGGPFGRGDLGQVERSVGRLRTMHSKMLMDIEKVQVHFGGSVKASSQMIRELLQAQCLGSPCYKRDTSDYTYSTVPRRCGGSHTLTYPYRRSRLQHLPQGLCPIEEIQIAMKHDEVDILGLDGHIYKGRMATRLPGVLGKDAAGMPKKAKLSRLPLQRQQPPREHSQLPSRPQSAQMLPGSSSAPSSQRKDRPLSSEGRLSQLNTAGQSSPSELGSLPEGLHMDVPPGEGLAEPTRDHGPSRGRAEL
ncbi:PREDICTED: glutamine-rich protein 2 [Condylura cristata]|uniref:glutamine-rich protein 2 n=1 Tax=Condylura cristata TaxID=143302 RepID=UPI000642C4F0|nr:PREDICTED: glutamine-rich protein 2 [Condylura cristata]